MTTTSQMPGLRAAEFFAGIGLVRQALASAGVEVVFANDISETKRKLYSANFDATHFIRDDIANVHGTDLPDIDIATASFPCTDLSLAGNRAGIHGSESGAFWHFARVLDEMGERRPRVILLENVAGLGSSRGGDDLRAAVTEMNRLGYWCDILTLDARWWVPQSRPRVFVIGSLENSGEASPLVPSRVRPPWVLRFWAANRDLKLQAVPLAEPDERRTGLCQIVESLASDDQRWWDRDRVFRFEDSLSDRNRNRLSNLIAADRLVWRTAYRRTRAGRPMWEIREDDISGCLRTARGGSSKQALVEAGRGELRVRWMTAREYARLMGADDYDYSTVTESQAIFGFGDAVCVPAVGWLIRQYVFPLASGLRARLVAV